MIFRKILLLMTIIPFFMNAQNTQSKLDSVVKKHQLMGLSVYVKADKKIENYSFGLRNINQNLPVTENTRFRVASISKAFTALGLIKLFDKKKFKLDDDISDYMDYKIRNPNFPDAKITFAMLLSHTSTLNDGDGYDGFLSDTYAKDTIPAIKTVLLEKEKYFSKNIFLEKKPGTYFTYCNLNYGLIGTLIERISKQRFDVFMENEILKPLGILGSYSISQIKEIDNVAALYRSENGVWKATKDDYSEKKPKQADLSKYEIGTNGVFYGPQGGLRITAKEATIFLDFVKSDGKSKSKLISQKTMQLMKKTQWKFDGTNGDSYNNFYNEWALGLHKTNTNNKDIVNKSHKFGRFIGHAGEAYGLISDAFYSENKKFSIVLITNGSMNEFVKGKKSSFFEFEEEIFDILCNNY